MDELSTTDAREIFAELVSRVAFGKKRVIITRNGKRQVAVVPIEDLERLEALERARGVAALRRIQEDAVSKGLNKLTAADVDATIRGVHDEGRPKAKRK